MRRRSAPKGAIHGVPKGVKHVRKTLASGELKFFWYHRESGRRIDAEPFSAAALLQVKQLDAASARQTHALVGNPSKSYAALWDAYVLSPEWDALKPRTKSDYQKVRDWLGPAALAAFPARMTAADMIALRDKALKEHKWRFAKYVLQVMSLTLEWSKPRGWLRGNPEGNPAWKLRMVRRKKGHRKLNRKWKDEEVRGTLASDAPLRVKLPYALRLFSSMREGDAVVVPWTCYDGERLRWKSGKNDEDNDVPVTGVLKTLLEEAKKSRGEHPQICLNSLGRPWASESSLRSAFFKTVRKLQKEGLIGPGATFHGLRHTVGASGRNDGASDFHVAAALGDRSTAMAALYGAEADRRQGQDAVLGSLQERFADAPLETKLETASRIPEECDVIPLKSMEAWPRIELGCADLQSAA